MASADRELTILLKLLADTAGATQVRAQLTALQTEQTNLSKQANALGATELSTTQATAAAKQTLNTIMERRVIIETQLEAAEARIAGNTALAARLEREAVIRTQALTIQRAMNVTTEESIVLAERLVVAQELGAVATNTMGINMAKAKTEALVLGRELAAGNVRASTLSSLLGSLGTSLTIAGIGAYELYHFISGQVDQTRELTKEYEKIVEELRNASGEWDTLATRAETFGDQVKIAEKIKSDLDKMGKDMDAFRKKELPLWQRFWDDLVTHNDNAFNVNGVLGKPNQGGPGPFEADRQKKVLEESTLEIKKANDELNKTQKSTDAWAAAQANVGQGLADYSVKLSEAEAKLAELNDARLRDPGNKGAYDAFVAQLGVVNDLKSKVGQLGDQWDRLRKTQDQEAHRQQMQQINALMREQATLLERIRQQQQLINQNPFLSADQKQALTLASMTAEMAALGGAIAQTKQQLSGSPLDSLEHERLQGQLQKDQFEFDLLHQKIAAINAPFATELIAWVNSLGTAAHQAAGIITGTLQTAIDGISQSITGLILGTQNWEQAWNNAVTSIIGNIVKVVVQFIAGQIAMFVIRQVLGTQEQAVTSKAAASSAAQWAPAAISASIASYGAASGFGVAAYIAALGLGEAAAAGLSSAGSAAGGGGGYAKGGKTGSNAHLAMVGEEGPEFVFTHRAATNIGFENLYAMMHAAERAPRFGVGGRVYEDAGYFGGRATLPSDPGEIEPPILFGTGNYVGHARPNPRTEPTVDVFRRGGPGSVPYWNRTSPGGYNSTPNYPANFGGNLALAAFSAWSNLGYGTRPYGAPAPSPGWVPVSGAPGVLEQSAFTNDWTWNSSRGLYERFESGSLLTSSGFIDPATGLILPPSTSSTTTSGRSGSAGGEFAGGAGFSHSADYIGYGPSSRSLADLRVMADQARAGGGNNMGTTGDAGHTIFNPGGQWIGKFVDGTLVHVLHPYGRADGGRIPGPASRADNILAWLSPGEHVIDAFTTAKMDRAYGTDWPSHMASMRVNVPRLASGGRIGIQRSEVGGQKATAEGDVHVYIFDDRRKAQRAYEESPYARRVFRERLNRYS